VEGGTFALMGTTMSPGFDGTDFEIGQFSSLTSLFPKFSDLINKLSAR
jgi:predicted cupin superfamily sugar epimerase